MDYIQTQIYSIKQYMGPSYEKYPETYMRLVEELIIQYINDIPISNIINKFINDYIEYFEIAIIAKNNYFHILKVSLLCNEFDYHQKYGYGKSSFYKIFNDLIVDNGDFINIFKVLEQFWKVNLYEEIDYEFIFKTALVEGYENMMYHALDMITYNSKYNNYNCVLFDTFKLNEALIYSIIGKNMRCVRHIINIYNEDIKDNKLENYLLFAAVFGTFEIIQYLISLKPYIINKIKYFYTTIFECSMFSKDITMTRWAIDNNAMGSIKVKKYIENMIIKLDVGEYDLTNNNFPKNLNNKIDKFKDLVHNYD